MGYDLCRLQDLDLPRFCAPLTGPELIRQRLEIRLNTHRGEVLRNAALGLPYLEWAQTMPAPVEAITSAIIDEAASTPGVLAVRDARPRFDVQTGTYSITLFLTLDEQAEPVVLALEPVEPTQLGVPWAVIMTELL